MMAINFFAAVGSGIGVFIALLGDKKCGLILANEENSFAFGTMLGVGAKAGYLDKDVNLPGIDKYFEVDAVATSLACCSVCPA